MDSEKSKILAAKAEEDQVVRNLLIFLNAFPELPVDTIRYEHLLDEAPAMALSSIQGTYITARYITGGHRAEYQFKIIYRIKPGKSIDQRLKADELLDRLGEWAATQRFPLGEGITNIRLRANSRSAVFAAYNDGSEDHQILMTLTYEVI